MQHLSMMLKSTNLKEHLSLGEIQRKNEEYRLNNMSMNELRARLYNEGVDYPHNATRNQLISLIKKQG